MSGRYAQCDDTCTVDCGHCKGAGRPADVSADGYTVELGGQTFTQAQWEAVQTYVKGTSAETLSDAATWSADVTSEPNGGQGLRDALRIHHPIMRSETGPFSGCRCGQVRLGQDVIAHVVTELRAALDGEPKP